MATCPVCNAEFPPGSRCPEHGGLVDRLHPELEADYSHDRLVSVATVWSDAMAYSWAEMLRNNGIPALIKTGGVGFSLGGPPPFGFECYLMAPETLAPRARAILQGFEQPGVLEIKETSS